MNKRVLLITVFFISIIIEVQHTYGFDEIDKSFLKFSDEMYPLNFKKEPVKSSTRKSSNTISIPDTNFEQALINLGYDTNGLNGNILTSDAEAITSIDIVWPDSRDISDLTGIDSFSQLTYFKIVQSELTNVDVSQNSLLQTLNIRSAKLASLTVNDDLISLSCINSRLPSLNITNATDLTNLNLYGNALTSLDVSTNTNLETLNLGNNDITAIDVSTNLELLDLGLGDNYNLVSIDVSNIIKLQSLNVEVTELRSNNNVGILSALDVSNNINLTSLSAGQNSITTIDITNNTELDYLSLRRNLLTNIDVSANTKLQTLNLERNDLTSINLATNTNLYSLNVRQNELTTLDLSSLANLTFLSCGLNLSMASLDVTNNVSLASLNCSDSQSLTTLSLGNTDALQYLNVAGNSLTTLDVSKHNGLIELNCAFNNLTSLILNDGLELLGASNNNLSTIDLTSNTNLVGVMLDRNSLSAIDLSNNTKLISLQLWNNNFTSVDVSKNINLNTLLLDNNNLTTLDISENTKIEILHCSENNLSEIDFGTNTIIYSLLLDDNLFTEMDVSNFSNLTTFHVFANPNLECIKVNDISYANTNFQKDATASFNLGCGINNASTDGSWSDPTVWSTGFVPTADDNITIPSGTTLQIDDEISEINSLVNEGTIIINPTFSLKTNTTLVNNGTIEMDSESDDSSVLFIKGASTGNIVYKRGGLKANKWSLVTPPVSGQKIKEFATNVDNDIRINSNASPNQYAIGYYDENAIAGEQWKYYTTNVSASETFNAGESYSMSRASDGEVTFTGTLTTEDAIKTLVAGRWNPIGNPFTTYYPATKNSENSFLNQNYDALDDAFKGIYLWSTSQNKFVVATELDANSRSLAPGQGFFIRLKSGVTDVEFNEDKRTLKPNEGNSSFAKNNDMYVELALENNKYQVKTAIKFYSNATLGFDIGYDIRNFDGSSFDLYSHLADESSKDNYSIQSIPDIYIENSVIPLGLNLSSLEDVKFTISAVNLPEGINVFIEDRLLNTYNIVSIDNPFSPDFGYETNNKNRFFVHFKSSNALSTDGLKLDKATIFVTNSLLHIEGINSKKSIKIYDTLGQEIMNKNVDTNTNQIDLPQNITKGVYLVSVSVNDQIINKKLIIK